jgi:hypothetical protein
MSQLTSMANEHGSSGEYHWSRGDQSYFDVTCPAYPLRMNDAFPRARHVAKGGGKIDPTTADKGRSSARRTRPPILRLSLYSRKFGGSTAKAGHKQQQQHHGNWPFGGGVVDAASIIDKDDDKLIGRCHVNVLRILCGKTPYFDEWCALYSDDDESRRDGHPASSSPAGRVRIVVEYEPTDPPPRPGDLCVFANVRALRRGLYPVAPYSIRNASGGWSSGRNSGNTSNSSSLTRRPMTYRVEEVVGDNVVLSHQTPNEGWTCTFEVHRYMLLCVERHQGAAEKYREQVLDLCDNLSQSPVVDVLAKTMETLPDEGLVHVGAELVGASLGLLGRWWETGLDGMIEDLVDGSNLDGRHSHYSDEDEKGDDNGDDEDAQVQRPSPSPPNHTTEATRDDRKPIPGMPYCPITGQQMIEPVVAADGHTYERYAIARWLETSSRSPLTGEILAHNKLVPNYLLLSSLSSGEKRGDTDPQKTFVKQL